MRRLVVLLPLLCHCAKAPTPTSPNADAGIPYVIEIDIDDHGLNALWNAKAPNLKKLIAEGTLAYSHVVVPTHSNENNMTLVSGNWPDGHNVPTNSNLNRYNDFKQGLQLGGIGVGDYVYYDQNPFNPAQHHWVDSVWSTTHAASQSNLYVGLLPPWEWGTDQAHLPLVGIDILGLSFDASTVAGLLEGTLGYPTPLIRSSYSFDGPPNAMESINHFDIRDASQVWAAAATGGAPPRYMFVWAFLGLDNDPTSTYGADAAQVQAVVDDYDDAIGGLLANIAASPYASQVNILFTLDHGKVNTSYQVALGSGQGDGQLGKLVSNEGSAHHVGPFDYNILNEDGDALIYAITPDAGNPYGAAAQEEIAHGLVELIQEGNLVGVDTTRTITWDGYLGTRRMHDYRIESPYAADVIVFPLPNWTLNDVDGSNVPGPFSTTVHPYPYGRHGGFSNDELYVPLIMWGPAFKKGVIIPHPIDHADVAPTAMKILGLTIPTAEGTPIEAALASSTVETLPDPGDMSTSRDLILSMSGFEGSPALAGEAAQQVVVVDVAGLYYDEVFNDAVTQPHAQELATLATSGTSFASAVLRYRDWAENEYEFTVGGAPGPTVQLSADADPTFASPPGAGMLMLPGPALGTASNPDALTAWRSTAAWAPATVFQTARTLGATTALFGTPDFHTNHLPADSALGAAQDVSQLGAFLSSNPKALAFVALGAKRTGDRHSAAALAELDALNTQLTTLRAAAPNALFIITSRGATDIDDASGDYYGPRSSQHVPLIVVGPNIRAGVVTGQPANAADLPATLLYAMGAQTRTDLSEGTWMIGTPGAGGVPSPSPAGAVAGHVLLRAFTSP